jgi:hypothetical protein
MKYTLLCIKGGILMGMRFGGCGGNNGSWIIIIIIIIILLLGAFNDDFTTV